MKKIIDSLEERLQDRYKQGDVVESNADNHGAGYPPFQVDSLKILEMVQGRPDRYVSIYRQFQISDVRQLVKAYKKAEQEIEVLRAKVTLLEAKYGTLRLL